MGQYFILIVDDMACIREMLQCTLELNEMNTSLASDGVEALEQCRNHVFDLIITDQNMPKMNGVEFIQELRKNPLYVTTPVIVLSSDDDAYHRYEEFRSQPGIERFIKCEEPDDLPGYVRRRIEETRASGLSVYPSGSLID